MAVLRRSELTSLSLPLLLVNFCFLILLSSSALAIATGGKDGYLINGRVKLPGFNGKGLGLPVKATNAKVILNSGQQVTFLKPDDVSARNPGKVQAALTENRRGLNELVLEPMREEQYYEIREPFNIMSLVKSPMGLMIGFMVIVVFLMPKLVENMDPEEIRKAQEEMRNQGVPSIANMMSGGGRNN